MGLVAKTATNSCTNMFLKDLDKIMLYRTIIKMKYPPSTCSSETPETINRQKPEQYRPLYTAHVFVHFLKYPHWLTPEARFWTVETLIIITRALPFERTGKYILNLLYSERQGKGILESCEKQGPISLRLLFKSLFEPILH